MRSSFSASNSFTCLFLFFQLMRRMASSAFIPVLGSPKVEGLQLRMTTSRTGLWQIACTERIL